ncbi:thioredoxin domain-containing protein, partial [Halobacteriales archaeon QH_6_66_25]
MTESADATKVEWREWGQKAFDVADRAAKPVLLALVTPWSAECREMDTTTYAEPRIAANINDGFVPVRVDADRHPR